MKKKTNTSKTKYIVIGICCAIVAIASTIAVVPSLNTSREYILSEKEKSDVSDVYASMLGIQGSAKSCRAMEELAQKVKPDTDWFDASSYCHIYYNGTYEKTDKTTVMYLADDNYEAIYIFDKKMDSLLDFVFTTKNNSRNYKRISLDS